MVANVMPAAPPPLSPQKVKIQFFQNMVMLHIKGIANAATWLATGDRSTINMKQIKRDFGSKICAGPLGGLR